MKSYGRIIFLLFSLCPFYAQAQLLDKLKKAAREVENKVANSIDGVSDGKKSTGNKTDSKSDGPKQTTERLTFTRSKVEFRNASFSDFSYYTYKGLPLMWDFRYFVNGEINSGDSYDLVKVKELLRIGVFEKMYRQKVPEFEKMTAFNDLRPLNDYANDVLKGALVNAFLSDKGKLEYFGDAKRPGYKWGGVNVTEFQQRRVYNAFMEHDFDSFINTASSFPNQVYTMFGIELPAYDFEKKGYVLPFTSRSDIEITFPYNVDTESRKRSRLISMSASEAEALANRLKNRQNQMIRNTVFAVMKIEFTRSSVALNKYYNYKNGKSLLNRVADPVMEIYEDPFLQHKLGELDFSELLSESEEYEDISDFRPSPLSVMDFNSKDERLKSFKALTYKGVPLIAKTILLEDLSFAFFPPGANPVNYKYLTHLLNFQRKELMAKNNPLESGQLERSSYFAINDFLAPKTIKELDWKYEYGFISHPEQRAKATGMNLEGELKSMAGNVPKEVFLVWDLYAAKSKGGLADNQRIVNIPETAIRFAENGFLFRVRQTAKETTFAGEQSFVLTVSPEAKALLEKNLKQSVFDTTEPAYNVYAVQKARIIPITMRTTDFSMQASGENRYVSFFYCVPGDEAEIFADKFLRKKIATVKIGMP